MYRDAFRSTIQHETCHFSCAWGAKAGFLLGETSWSSSYDSKTLVILKPWTSYRTSTRWWFPRRRGRNKGSRQKQATSSWMTCATWTQSGKGLHSRIQPLRWTCTHQLQRMFRETIQLNINTATAFQFGQRKRLLRALAVWADGSSPASEWHVAWLTELVQLKRNTNWLGT